MSGTYITLGIIGIIIFIHILYMIAIWDLEDKEPNTILGKIYKKYLIVRIIFCITELPMNIFSMFALGTTRSGKSHNYGGGMSSGGGAVR